MITIKNSRLREALRLILPFGLIPVCVFLMQGQNYALATAVVAILSMLLFICGFERKKTGTRRLILIAAMVALSVIGRFIPFFKPVTALTVLTAIYLGGEAGFLTGALSAMLSNFYFGQGPWTPFQMLSLGLIGLFAGLLSAPLRKSRLLTVLYGVLAGIAYSWIMDVWTVLWYNGDFSFSLYCTAIVTALPHTILYAVSNAVFLWAFAKPLGEKLARVKLKYGV